MRTYFAARAAASKHAIRLNERAIRRNLRLLQIFRVVYCAEFTFTTIVLFFQQNGLSQSEIFWIFGALGGTGVLFEIPSGWLADRFGRKWCLLCATILMITGFLTEAVSREFVFLLIANGFIGAGYSFVSGSDSALAYDSIKDSNWDEETQRRASKRFERMGQVYGASSGLVGVLIGTWIAATWDIRLTIWLQVPVYCLLIPIALSLKEAKGQREVTEEQSGKTTGSMFRTMKYAFCENHQLRGFVLYFAAVGTFGDILIVTMPLYCQLAGISIGGLGGLTIVALGASGVGGVFAERYEKWLGPRIMWWSFVLVPSGAFILLAVMPPSVWVLLPAMIGAMFVFGISMPSSRVKINELATSEVRATILSIGSWTSRLVFLSTAWLVGRIIDDHSLQGALLLCVLMYGLGGAIALFAVTRKIRSD